MFALAFPPVGLWWLAFLAPVPLFWVMARGTDRPARSALLAVAGTIPFWAYVQVWVLSVSALGYWPFILVCAFYGWLAISLGALVRRRWPAFPMVLLAPIVWVGVEFFRGRLAFDGYPWYLIGHPLIEAPALSWLASLQGELAVSALVAAVGGSIVDAASHRSRATRLAAPAAAAAALASVAILGSRAAQPPAAGAVRIAVIQTNIPQDNKSGWTLRQRILDWTRFKELMSEAAPHEPDLIVLPETMFPGRSIDPEVLEIEAASSVVLRLSGDDGGQSVDLPLTIFADDLGDYQLELGVPILVGYSTVEGLRFRAHDQSDAVAAEYDRRFNSAAIVSGGGRSGPRYDKLQLTPFGEVMPYISNWDWLEDQFVSWGAHGMLFDLSPGRAPVTLAFAARDGREVRLATPICFEATMAAVCRRLVFSRSERRADLLVNLTNDGWFGDWDIGREHHALMARWRAVELGTPMIRAANTGISSLIDARGRLVREGVEGRDKRARVDGILVVETPLATGPTTYARAGDVLGWLTLAGSFGLALAAFVGQRLQRRARASADKQGA